VEPTFFAILGLGFLLGLKHATDADHVVAVTTFVSREQSLLRSCWVGLFWGAGHTLSLALGGSLIILLKLQVTDRVTEALEFAVAVMLVVLGVRVLYQIRNDNLHFHRHSHVHPGNARPHAHWHLHSHGKLHEHANWLHFGLRPLIIGMVHGAAGTGALMLLVLSTIRLPSLAFLYILVFGFGSIAGMLLISLLLAIPMQWAAKNVASGYRVVQTAAGVLSCVFGIYLGLGILSHLLE